MSDKCDYLQGAIGYINKGTVHKEPVHVSEHLEQASKIIDEAADVDCLDYNKKTPLMNLINIFDILTLQQQTIFMKVAKKLVEKSRKINIIVKKPGIIYGSTKKTALDMVNKQINKYTNGDVPEELSSLKKLIVDKGGKTADELNKPVNLTELTSAERQAARSKAAKNAREKPKGWFSWVSGGTRRRKRLSRSVTRRIR